MKMVIDINDPIIGNIRIEFGNLERTCCDDLSFIDEYKIKVFPYTVFEWGELSFSGNYFNFLYGRRGIMHQTDEPFLYYVNAKGEHIMSKEYMTRMFEVIENVIEENEEKLWSNDGK